MHKNIKMRLSKSYFIILFILFYPYISTLDDF